MNEILIAHRKHRMEESAARRLYPMYTARAARISEGKVNGLNPGELFIDECAMKDYDSGMILETYEETIAKQVQREDEFRHARAYVPPEIPKMRYPKVKMTRTSLAAFFRQFLP